MRLRLPEYCFFFFFNDTATTEIYTLSLHDALPIFDHGFYTQRHFNILFISPIEETKPLGDRKSTRLNSSHLVISYAVFCLKKKNKKSVISCLLETHLDS